MGFVRGLICLAFVGAVGCIHTKPGTHVELVDQDGGKLYVAGAAAPGVSQSIACRAAVSRAAAAVAHRFAQEEEDIGDDVADLVGVSDGVQFLYAFANAQIVDATVQDTTYDPTDHLCMATVRWKPPVFLKEAVKKYADELKVRELQPAADSNEAPADSVAPRASSSGSHVPPAVAPAPRPVCAKEKANLKRAATDARTQTDYFKECKRRTGGDVDACHGYKLRRDEAQAREQSASSAYDTCMSLER